MVDDTKQVKKLHQQRDELFDEIGKVIIGQKQIIRQLLIAQLSRGHCLLIGVPGLAKTMMISSLAELMDLKFSRIQFTPDLMPSDITGTEILEEDRSTGKRAFKFVKGPVFGNIILADEINRTPPKTQAALLEAMQENKVTAAGEDYNLEAPFFVLATQNPIEQEGTYPLPEAQLDRFMFSLNIDYPPFEDEIEIVKSTTIEQQASLETIISREQILEYQKLVRRVPVADNVIEFAVKLSVNSRPGETDIDFVKEWVDWGAGPRASQYLVLAAKASAALDGRPAPGIQDIIDVAKPVLRHRIIPNFNAEAEGIDSNVIVEKLIKEIQ
ncbi:MAG TPA: MoxR family ATPase [bacterium]|nr:MoxR family ATPase [bacterium]